MMQRLLVYGVDRLQDVSGQRAGNIYSGLHNLLSNILSANSVLQSLRFHLRISL